MIEPLYFGTHRGESGHYCWNSAGEWVSTRSNSYAQLLADNDARLAPQKEDKWKEGRAAIHHYPDFTILAFWDYTGDSRPGSNSMFLFAGRLTFEQALTMAKEHFGWKKFPANIQLS